MRACVLVAVVLTLLARSALAEECPANPELRSYLKPAALPGDKDTRCDFDAKGKCTALDLKGFLYVPPATAPKGPGGYPILIYNHGSEQAPGMVCDIGTYFRNLGYVVFVPHRRGHGRSTGVYLDRYTKDFCSTRGDGGACKMEYLHKQVDDVEAAIAFARTVPGVDAKNVALFGHSFGGIVTVFANAKDLGQRAAVDMAGGSQSWMGNPECAKQMAEAVRAGVAPTFFFEPLNDKSIGPTLELAKIAGETCHQYQAAIYAPVDVNDDGKVDLGDYQGDLGDGKTVRDKAHGKSTHQLDEWGPAVHEFISRYFRAPAGPVDKLCQGTSYVAR
jgi:dienelactone hydrolase